MLLERETLSACRQTGGDQARISSLLYTSPRQINSDVLLSLEKAECNTQIWQEERESNRSASKFMHMKVFLKYHNKHGWGGEEREMPQKLPGFEQCGAFISCCVIYVVVW